jgi:hypothetical protein
VTAACADTSPRSATNSTRDSAGITIVENASPAWTDADAWRLSDTATLTLGTEGDSAQEFFQVAGAVRLSDGTIVVANNGSSELRFFSPDGALRARAGRKGAGPGEFQGLMHLERLPGDSLLTYDLMNRRLSVFDANGRHGRDISLSGGSEGPLLVQIAGRLADGRYATHGPNTRLGLAMLNRPAGPARDSVVVLLLDPAGGVSDTLGVFPGARVNVSTMEMMGRSIPMPVPVPFSPNTTVAAADTVIYIGTSDTYEIRVLSPDARLRRLIRYARAPRPVTDSDKAAFHERIEDVRITGPVAAMMDQFRKAVAEVEFPETMPAYGRLMVDAEGNLWVADERSAVWSVFDPAGRLLGSLTLPDRFQVRDIGSDYVLGEMTDEAETERVLLYRLIKPPRLGG